MHHGSMSLRCCETCCYKLLTDASLVNNNPHGGGGVDLKPSKICFLLRRGDEEGRGARLFFSHCLHRLSSRQLGPDPPWRPSRPFRAAATQAIALASACPRHPHRRCHMEGTFARHHFMPLSPSFSREKRERRSTGGGRAAAAAAGGRLTLSGCETKMAAETFCLLPLVLVVVSRAEY